MSSVSYKISELSRETGAPVPTIKFYIREGLLPPGEHSAPTQAVYGQRHVERLELIRALRETAGLSIDAIRQLVAAMEDRGLSLPELVSRAHEAIGPARNEGSELDEAEAEVGRELEQMGWRVAPNSASRRALAETLLQLREQFFPELEARTFVRYAQAIEPIAQFEVRYVLEGRGEDGRDPAIKDMVLGTLLWERVLTNLRRAAHEHFVIEAMQGASHEDG